MALTTAGPSFMGVVTNRTAVTMDPQYDFNVTSNNTGGSGTTARCATLNFSHPVKVDVTQFSIASTAGILTILGNLMSLLVIGNILRRRKDTRNGSTIYLFSLASSDFLQALFVYPIHIAAQVKGQWLGGYFTCMLMAYAGNFFYILSAFIVTLLAIVRYFATSRPLSFRPHLEHTSLWMYIFFGVILFAVIIIAMPFTRLGCISFHASGAICSYDWYARGLASTSTILILGTQTIMLLVIICCTVGTIYSLHSHSKLHTETLKRMERNFSMGVVAIATVQVICWGPFVPQEAPHMPQAAISCMTKPMTFKEANFKAKVTIRVGTSEERQRYIMEEGTDLSIVKGLFSGAKQRVVKAIFEDEQFREPLTKCFNKQIEEECAALCTTVPPSLFRTSTVEHLAEANPGSFLKELKEKSPTICEVISSIIGKKMDSFTRKNKYAASISSAILLHQRNIHLSSLLYSTSLLLDFGGATDATLRKCHTLGLCVHTSALNSKKKEVAKYQERKIEETITARSEIMETSAVLKYFLNTVKLYSVNKCESHEQIKWVIKNVFPSKVTVTPDFITSLETSLPAWEIYGDNVDHSIKSHHVTKHHRGEDIHWFLLLGAQLRVQPPPHLDTTRPRRSILQVANDEFLPSIGDMKSFRENAIFHIMEVLVTYIPWLASFKAVVPKFIPHDFLDEMRVQSKFCILDLLEKSENKSDEMIDILQAVHKYIPSSDFIPCVPERMVFGGDELTNERAYQSQLDMQNGTNEPDSLKGIIHRTEGLHLCMNLCKLIMEYFFSKSSTRDAGTLYNLKVQLDRKDIKLDMTQGYNSCKHFIDDILDGHIVAAALRHFNVQSLESESPLPLSDDWSKEDQYEFIYTAASSIVDETLMFTDSDVENSNLDLTDSDLERNYTKAAGTYKCNFTGCKKSYQQLGWMKNHLRKKHNVDIEIVSPITTEKDSTHDGKMNYAVAFMKAAILFRDTRDCFKMGDGNRLFRNLRFLLLYFDISKHYKYRIWSWRLLAYDLALLSEKERHVYRNNISVNVVGGTRRCIANDNLVEIHVKKVKQCMRAMGANVTFSATRTAAKCLSTVSALIEDEKRSGRHSAAKTADDVKTVVECLQTNEILVHTPGREHSTYPNMAADLTQRVNLVKLKQWFQTQKVRANIEM